MITLRSAAGLALGALTLALSAWARPTAGDDIPFARFGQEFLTAHGAKAPADLTDAQLLERHCARGAFGLFDVAFPASSLGDKTQAENLQKQCAALIALQKVWIEWLVGSDPRAEPAKKSLAELATWIQGWKSAALAKAATAENKDLYALCGASDAVRQAQKSASEFLAKTDVLGVAPRDGKRLSLLFAPTRHDFVQLLGYGGLADPAQQSLLWVPSSVQWTTFWIGWNFVLALEYPGWGSDPDFKGGTSMNKFEATGMQQHTVQNAANALQWLCYGEDDATYLHQAVSMNLAIAVTGELNTLEGDTVRGNTGAETKPYEKFVPGGNPGGGYLPPIPAASQDMLKDGRWREDKGKDHYAAVLRKNQKEGLKQLGKDKPKGVDEVILRDKQAHFLLLASEGGTKHVASAPFFGPAANEKPYPPQPVLLDYREFFRAYKCCFQDWLQQAGDKAGAEASHAHFQELLRKLATREKDVTFESVVQQVYGVPLSAKNGETDTLEWRFLAWLNKGR